MKETGSAVVKGLSCVSRRLVCAHAIQGPVRYKYVRLCRIKARTINIYMKRKNKTSVHPFLECSDNVECPDFLLAFPLAKTKCTKKNIIIIIRHTKLGTVTHPEPNLRKTLLRLTSTPAVGYFSRRLAIAALPVLRPTSLILIFIYFAVRLSRSAEHRST